MKLTKLQRHTAYIIMLAEAKTGEYYDYGMCFMFAEHFDSSLYSDKIFKSMLPELYRKRPKCNCYWFYCNKQGWQQRIELLNQCVIETA